MRTSKLLLLFCIVASIGWLCLANSTTVAVRSQSPQPQGSISGAIRVPASEISPVKPVGISRNPASSTGGLKAVAIVGDVESHTVLYKSDMDSAVSTLQGRGVAVSKFYYGDSSFTWSDIVAAAQGAHFLLYMGHGVYGWGGDPENVGGFYLGPSQFVSPDQIRQDLNDVVASHSVVIFSHACFTAGSAAGDPPGLSQAEAERRVKMYAGPFTDIGMQAYFANNYNGSAARTAARIVDQHMMEDAFKSGIGYIPQNLRDLSYPTMGYDLWLDGVPGDWDLAFVGLPTYVFQEQVSPPALGNLPEAISFTYSTSEQRLLPTARQLALENVGNNDPLTWTVTITGTWFSVSPETGTTPQSLQVTPTDFVTDTASTYTGAIGVEVIDPSGGSGSPQTIQVSLQVMDLNVKDVYLPFVTKAYHP
jgi:hypothetical protein